MPVLVACRLVVSRDCMFHLPLYNIVVLEMSQLMMTPGRNINTLIYTILYTIQTHISRPPLLIVQTRPLSSTSNTSSPCARNPACARPCSRIPPANHLPAAAVLLPRHHNSITCIPLTPRPLRCCTRPSSRCHGTHVRSQQT